MRLLGLISRFGFVGIAATLTYLVGANILIHFAVVGPGFASVIAYLAGMAVSYIGQSRWTFQGAGGRWQLARFMALSAAGLVISYAAPHAAQGLGLPVAAGTMIPILAVPLISFLAMRYWVFTGRSSLGEPVSRFSISRTVNDEENGPSA
jgi:putative flippase GtrA